MFWLSDLMFYTWSQHKLLQEMNGHERARATNVSIENFSNSEPSHDIMTCSTYVIVVEI